MTVSNAGPSSAGADPDAPLWRAASAFRLITVIYAVGHQVIVAPNYDSQRLSWLIIALVVVWSGTAGVAVLGRGNRVPVVIADQVFALAATGSTRLVSDADWYATHQVLPTTLWVTNAVVSAAILRGPVAGFISGAVMALGVALTRGQLDPDLWRDATGPVLMSVGVALGVASVAARRAQQRLEEAIGVAAAARERERLAREVHDGVLQVLAMVTRRGNEIGGAAIELAVMAAQQEVALRTLISANRVPVAGGSVVDLRTVLQASTSVSVSVSTPGDPVPVNSVVADEVGAAVRSALTNVVDHAGPAARAFVLLEGLGEEVIVSIRDDGVGMAPGRAAEAAAAGRMGMSKSIVGRIQGLGGTATLESALGEGTEWELRVPSGVGKSRGIEEGVR